MVDTLLSLAADLASISPTVERRTRGVTAKHADRAAGRAKDDALSSWTRYGRGESGSAGTIRARMSNTEKTVGYMIADGQGAFQSEHGTSSIAPKPVMGRAARSVLDEWASDIGDMAEDVLS